MRALNALLCATGYLVGIGAGYHSVIWLKRWYSDYQVRAYVRRMRQEGLL